MYNQAKQITTRLNQLAGVSEPEGRNVFKPLKDTLTFEKQRNKYVVFNYNKGDSVFDYDIIATFPTRKAAVSFIENTKQ